MSLGAGFEERYFGACLYIESLLLCFFFYMQSLIAYDIWVVLVLIKLSVLDTGG